MDLQYRDPYHYIDSFDDPAIRQLIRLPLPDLERQLESDDPKKSRLDELMRDYRAYRPCESDTQSLLRSFGFGLMEAFARQWTSSNDTFQRLREVVMDVTSEDKDKSTEQRQIISDVLERLIALCERDPDMTVYHVQTLLGKTWFDTILRTVLRTVLQRYISQHADDFTDTTDLIQIVADESSELSPDILPLLSRALSVNVVLQDMNEAMVPTITYVSDDRKPIDFALYRLENNFGVLYSTEDVEKDKFDPETRRFDVGSAWAQSS